QRLLLEARDILVGHTGEVIEFLVVFAHMIEAEAEIFALAHAADGRLVRARLRAAVPLAARRMRLQLRLRVGADPDLLEVARIGLHRFAAQFTVAIMVASPFDTRIDIHPAMDLTGATAS